MIVTCSIQEYTILRTEITSVSYIFIPPQHEETSSCQFTVIDSVDPVDLQFVFTSLSNWREGGKDTKIHPSSSTNIVPTLQFDQAAVSPSVSYAPLSVTEQQQKQVAELMPAIDKSELSVPSCGEVKRVLPGSLVMETYSWKTVQFGEPVLRISTTGTKGTILSLPPG